MTGSGLLFVGFAVGVIGVGVALGLWLLTRADRDAGVVEPPATPTLRPRTHRVHAVKPAQRPQTHRVHTACFDAWIDNEGREPCAACMAELRSR